MYVCIFSITNYNAMLDAKTERYIEESSLPFEFVCVCCHSANIRDDIGLKSLCLFLHVVCLFHE